MLDRRRGIDQQPIEFEQRPHRDDDDASSDPRLLLVVNARASGVGDPGRTARDLVALLQELGVAADGTVTETEPGLWEALAAAADRRRRVVLVGGDGSVHAAANAPLQRLPELALVPAGRANNIARALGIPTAPVPALAAAATLPARALDALLVQTPTRRLYAVEAVSAGFHAAARSRYAAANSADLRQGLRALGAGVRDFEPYRMRVRFDDGELASGAAAQLFVSNLPYFGPGFEVDPGADATDGRLEVILVEAAGRRRLLGLLAAARRGRHIGRRGVRRVSSRHAELIAPLPLVADTVDLGTTTATVTVVSDRLRVAGGLR